MKSIPKLKDEARKHEQKEEWEKAVNSYLQVLEIGEQGDGGEIDLPLYNRVGDLYVRLGRPADAVKYYEQAADRYAEAGLFNNAIALCNKALRYDASRLEILKKLGSFSASQGFFTDARRWYLEYVERSIKNGALDQAFDALSDYADVNDDAETRELLARQLRDHGRKEKAVEEFKRAYAHRMTAGQQAEADAIRAEIQAIDPEVDLSVAAEATHGHQGYASRMSEALPGLVDTDRAVTAKPKLPAAPAPPPVPEPAADAGLNIEQTGIEGGLDVGDGGDFGSINLESGFGVGLDSEEEVEPLDMGLEQPFGASDEPEEEESGGFELPTFDDDSTDSEESEATSLPTFEDLGDGDEAAADLPAFDYEAQDDDSLEPLPGFDSFDSEAEDEPPILEAPTFDSVSDLDLGSLDVGELERDEVGTAGESLPSLDFGSPTDSEEAVEADTADVVEAEAEWDEVDESIDQPVEAAAPDTAVEAEPEPAPAVEPAPAPAVEPAPAPEVEPEPAHAAERAPEPPRAPPAPAPKKPKGDYIDLASFLEDDEEEAEDSTRFVVAEKPPTGDEEKDFADMLQQFKAKVAETIPKEDAGSHYDLGIAFKEMGLIDEAIGEFQTALRAGNEKLKVYEELGSCFVMKQQYSVAISVLSRAAQMPYSDEQELLGVYYNLGRAHEELGQRAEAKAAFEKILAIDIGFQDAMERLTRL